MESTEASDIEKWWDWPDLNQRPPHLQCGALPAELQSRSTPARVIVASRLLRRRRASEDVVLILFFIEGHHGGSGLCMGLSLLLVTIGILVEILAGLGYLGLQKL